VRNRQREHGVQVVEFVQKTVSKPEKNICGAMDVCAQ
jgi:hypothetical protein